MPPFRTQAIVIRSLSYGESDKIVTFCTRDFGKLKGIAKGARRSKRRFQNVLGLFSHLRLQFFDREGMNLVRVEGGDLLHSFPNIRENLKKIYYGNYYLELMNEMSGERESNPEAFDLLLSFLTGLDATGPEEERLRMFEIRMLALFGYRPYLTRCGLCKGGWEEMREAPVVFFSLDKGTLICAKCAKNGKGLVSLSLGTARLIDHVSQTELSKLDRLRFTPEALAESRAVLPGFIARQIGKELKSLKAIREIGS